MNSELTKITVVAGQIVKEVIPGELSLKDNVLSVGSARVDFSEVLACTAFMITPRSYRLNLATEQTSYSIFTTTKQLDYRSLPIECTAEWWLVRSYSGLFILWLLSMVYAVIRAGLGT